MPSLNALGEFKFSFSNIGKEKTDLEAKNTPYHDLPLPTTEAVPIDFPVRNPEAPPPPEAGGFDMSAFFDSLPTNDVPEPSTEDIFGGFDMNSIGEPASDEPSTEDLLSGFDMGGMESTPSEESPDLGSFDLGGMSMGADEPLDTSAPEDAPAEDFGSFDLGGMSMGADEPLDTGAPEDTPMEEPPSEDVSGIDLGGERIDLGGESVDMGTAEPPPDTGSGDFDSGSLDMGGFDLGGKIEMPTASGLDTDSFDLGGETEVPTDSGFEDGGFDAGGEAPAAPIDLGDFGSDFSSDSIDLGSESGSYESETAPGSDFGSNDFDGESFGSSDFALDGIEDLFEKTKTEPIAPRPKESIFSKLRKKKVLEKDLPEAESDIEEIQLSESDVERLMRTIASYPLNLRIICEELIAEQVILPKQLSMLLRCLINGAHVRETAALVEEITGKPVVIPKSYEKMTGAAFEAEQASFAYIFFHNFLPVFRLFLVIAAFVASIAYLGYKFVYIPVKAEGLYKRGYELIPEGEYQRANQLFDEAFATHRKKKWFYKYAEAFRDERRYMLAEEKYDQLLGLTNDPKRNEKAYPRDKKGVLDYASLNTYYLLNYDKANKLLQEQLLNYAPNDYDGLVAAGDNFLLWAASDPERFYDKYEDARFCYARLLELNGWQVPLVERMLKYFIHTDNLKEVLHLRNWFESDKKRKLSPSSKAELAGYLLDKQLEEIKGVPNPYLEGIASVRAMLLEAIAESSPQIAKDKVKEPNIPEPHYHLARYHKILNNNHEERLALENAIRAFNMAPTETVRRRQYRVDAHYRYSDLLVRAREFFPAEENAVKGIELFEDFVERNLIRATASLPFSKIPQLGQLYAAKGDIEYFAKSGNMEAALTDYHKAEEYGYTPPEIQYRMGAAYYQLAGTPADDREEHSQKALEYLFSSSADMPLSRRMLYALGNAAYRRNDYFAAQGYYTRLIDILENQRVRLPVTLPNDDPQFLELGERMMIAYNNLGAAYEALADQTGNREYRAKAMSYYSESARAWDSITRNPSTMIRMNLIDSPGAPSVNQGYLNFQNAMRPGSNYIPQIFPRIDKDVLEPSRWEELAGAGGLQ